MMWNPALFRKIGLAILWTLPVSALGALWWFAVQKEKNSLCTQVDVSWQNPEHFINKPGMIHFLQTRFLGKRSESALLFETESALSRNPFIREVHLYLDLQGTLHVQLWQKHPVISATDRSGNRFLIDETGNKIPAWAAYEASLVQLTGSFSEMYHGRSTSSSSDSNTNSTFISPAQDRLADTLQSADLRQAFALWQALSLGQSHPFTCTALVVRPDHALETMVSTIPFPVVFGDTTRIVEKLQKLTILSTLILPKRGLESYAKVDLRFVNQWVCERKSLVPL